MACVISGGGVEGRMQNWIQLMVVVTFMLVGVARAGEMADLVESVGLAELATTFDEDKVDRILEDYGAGIEDPDERVAAAILVSMGMVQNWVLETPEVAARMLTGWEDPAVENVGITEMPLARPAGIMRIASFGGYDELRRDTELIAALDAAIGEKVLTGYGLRPRNVSIATKPDRTLIYSHQNLPHVRQLIGLMSSEGLKGRVLIAPKVAAFVFREGWGERPDWLNELGDGVYVAQGPEMLVHFEFASPEDRPRFDELVTKYAKKDSKEETGNLVNSWWQPFYYGESAAEGFHQISRVMLYGEEVEASLLMLPEREELVRQHFAEQPWEMKVDAIWVNAPFFRFLQGESL